MKTSACADALALNKYQQLQMPLPKPLLRGFNNFICVRGPDEEKSVHAHTSFGGTIPSPPSGGAGNCTNNVYLFLIAKTHISFLFYCHIINKWCANTGISRLFKWLQFIVLLEMIFVFAVAVRRKNKGHSKPTKAVACNSKWQWHTFLQ